MNIQDLFYTTEKFEWYGVEYFTALGLLSSIGAWLIWKGKNSNEKWKDVILKSISILLSSVILTWAVIEMTLGGFHVESDLPLIFCNFFALILPVFAFYRKQVLFNILYYIILAGAIQSIITPGLKLNFPHYEFLKFWTVHVFLIVFVLYLMIVFKKRPTFKGILHSLIFIQGYIVVIVLINWLLDSNYLYLNIKPEHDTLLALLGGWPWYIVWMDLILIPYFLILYLPVWLIFRKRGVKQKSTYPR